MKPTQTARTNAVIDGGDRQAAAYELRARHDAELTSCEFGDPEVCGGFTAYIAVNPPGAEPT